MGGHVYRKIELVGTNSEDIDNTIRTAIGRASQTIRNLDWFEVKEVRGWIENGQPGHFQVVLTVGFRLEGADDDE